MLVELTSIFSIGFLLGLRHAFDPDHVVAVSTVATRTKSLLQSAAAGIFWGIGHTMTLFVMGMILLPLGQTVPDNIGLMLEMAVAVLIIVLGISALLFFMKKQDDMNQAIKRPKRKSLFIGIVHGLAGSGALVLLTMSKADSLTEAAGFILIFGVGTILGMLTFALLISLPFVYLPKNTFGLERILGTSAGIFSVAFGFYFLYEIGFVEGLFL